MARQERITRLNRVYAVLSGINTLIARARNRHELFSGACRIAVEQGNFGIAWVSQVDPNTLEVTVVASAGEHAAQFIEARSTADTSLPCSNTSVDRAIRELKPIFDNDITIGPRSQESRRKYVARLGFRSIIVLPLIADGAAVGSVTLFAKEPNFFTNDELKLLTELASNISFALEHIAKEEKIARLSRIQAVMSGIHSLIVRVRDRQELFEGACKIATDAGNFGIAWIGMLDPKTSVNIPVARGGGDAGYLASAASAMLAKVPKITGIAGRALREKRAMFSNDLISEPLGGGGERRIEAIRLGYRSLIALPLIVQDVAVGSLSLFAKEPNFFTEDELTLLNQLASDISFALEHIVKEEKIARLSRIQAVMSGINSLIVRARDRQQLFDGACKIAAEAGNFGIVWLGMLDPRASEIVPVAWAGSDSEYLDSATTNRLGNVPEGHGMIGRAMKERHAVFSNDLISESVVGGERRKEAIRRGYRSLIALPLIVQDVAVGSLSLFAKEPNFFTEDELTLLNDLASDISFALEHFAKEEKIARLSRIQAVMSGINSLVIRVRDRQELFNGACKIATEAGNFGIAWIGTPDPKTSEIITVAWAGSDAEHLESAASTMLGKVPPSQGIAGRALTEKRAIYSNDLMSESIVGGERRKEAIRRGYRSLISLPLMVQGSAVGTLSLLAKEPNFFTLDELTLLNDLASDISFALEHIAKEERLHYLAYYDELTGLPNRTLFLDRLKQHLHARNSEPRLVAIILLDLERFRIVNETLGRRGGDELLRLVAQRLENACLGKEDLARVSANGYGVVLRGARDAAAIVHAVESQLFACFREPYAVNGTELRLAAKAGIALFPTDGGDTDTLFRNAEAALKKAKTSGDHYLFYAAEMNARAAQVLTLETRMRKAVDAQQFVLHYQPKIELASGRICGLEALIRWQDPESGLVPPGHFIPLLEETGLIIEVGEWALGQALADYRDWVARGYNAPRIAVNVSLIQLRRSDFVDMVGNVIGDMTSIPHGLDIEITESLIMENVEANIHKLKMLQDMGLNISIDDFGTGYSSLGYLARLPVDALKIDRSFIVAMSDNADSMTIVSAIISLGHSLDLKVIAEGVETEAQSRYLKLLKCDQMQGYIFSKPLPKGAIEPMLKRTARETHQY